MSLDKREIRLFQRIDKLQNMTVSMSERYARLPPLDDELANRRQERRAWVNLIVLRKMYARTLDELKAYYSEQIRSLRRIRKRLGDETYSSDRYNSLCAILAPILELRLENGNSILNLSDFLRARKLRLSHGELKAALSIPEHKWTGEQDIDGIMFLHIADESLTNQFFDAMTNADETTDENTRRRVHFKLQSLLGVSFGWCQ